MPRSRKPSVTPGEIKKAQKRQFKAICGRVDKHVQEFKTPVIMMGVVNGTLCFSGSETLKNKFCKNKDVQEKFLNIVSEGSTIFKSQESHDKSENCDPPALIDMEHSTYRFLRCYVADAVQRKYERLPAENQGARVMYSSENCPQWWPASVPFISPNHPPQGMTGLQLDQLTTVAECYQSFLTEGKSDNGEGSSATQNEKPKIEETLKSLYLAKDFLDFSDVLKTVPDELAKHASVCESSSHHLTDTFSCVKDFIDGTDTSGKTLRLVVIKFGAQYFHEYVTKLSEGGAHNRHVLLSLGSQPYHQYPQAMDPQAFLFQELKALLKEDTCCGVFHFILLAGALKICIYQQDSSDGCKFRNVTLSQCDDAAQVCTVVWKGRKATASRAVRNADDQPVSPDECWRELVSACVNTCKMAPSGQCVSKEIPGKHKVNWVQCTACEAWVHCICAGLSKDQLSGEQFVCCGSVNPENSFRTGTMYFKDVHSVYPNQGLSDAIISFYIRNLLPCSSMVTVVSPLLYQGICTAVTTTNPQIRFDSLKQALCVGENLKELIAFPCNLTKWKSQTDEVHQAMDSYWHWILVVVRIKDYSAWTLDSMGEIHHDTIVNKISAYLSFLMQETISLASKPLKVVHQKEGTVDCGIHVLHNLQCTIKCAKRFPEGMEETSTCTVDCPRIRGTILAALYKESLNRMAKNPANIRRSERCIQKQQNLYPPNVQESIEKDNDDGLQMALFPQKGRGVVTTRAFNKDMFICQYVGELITSDVAKERERKYDQKNVGCFMFNFKRKSKALCIDATKEDGRLGRLINHSVSQANIVPKIIDVGGKTHLFFRALRYINSGEELLYDYGERKREIIEANPWLRC